MTRKNHAAHTAKQSAANARKTFTTLEKELSYEILKLRKKFTSLERDFLEFKSQVCVILQQMGVDVSRIAEPSELNVNDILAKLQADKLTYNK